MSKEKQKKLLIEIMEADEKNGLYETNNMAQQGKLTFIEKQQWLRENGWYTLWSEDNWLQQDKTYSNPDCAGMNTDKAYDYTINQKEIS